MLTAKDVYVYEVVDLEGGGVSEAMIGFTTKLIYSGDKETAVNTPVTLTLHYEDWQGNPLPEENRPIIINISGTQINLTPVSGQAQYIFTSDTAGIFRISARADFACDRAIFEVIVV